MTAPEPTLTAEHIDAVARSITVTSRDGNGRRVVSKDASLSVARLQARTLLASTDPAVHAAMLDALVRAGVLTAETAGPYACPAEERSPWGGWVRCGKFDNHEDDHEDSTSGWHWPRDPDDLEDVPATPPHRLVTPWEVAP